jgi:putative flippase GtrA
MQKAGQNIVMVVAMVAYTLANYVYNRTVTFRVDPNANPGK